MADKAARHSAANDIEDFDDSVDFLSEKVHAIVRILIPDERLRPLVLADTFAKAFVDDLYTGDPFDDLELATGMVGELVAGHIIDEDDGGFLQQEEARYGYRECKSSRGTTMVDSENQGSQRLSGWVKKVDMPRLEGLSKSY